MKNGYEEVENLAKNKELIDKIGSNLCEYWKYLNVKKFFNKDEAVKAFINDEKAKISFLDLIEKAFFSLQGKRVLDIGCGKGGIIISCALRGAAKAIGIDIDEKELAIAKLRANSYGLENVQFFKNKGENLLFSDNSFDLVIATSVLEHVENPYKVLKEMIRVLSPGGIIFIILPNPIFPREGHYKVFYIPFLPKRFGSFYLRIMGYNPEFFMKNVNYPYPSIFKIEKLLKENNMVVRNLTAENILNKFENPLLIKNKKIRNLVNLIRGLKLNKFFAELLVKLHFYPYGIIVAQKLQHYALYNGINPEEYELRYMKYPRESYMWAHWYPYIKGLIAKYCKNKTVLDLGCGTGVYTEIIANYGDVIGLDVSKTMLEYAKRKRPNIKFILADAHSIPFESNFFDVVVSIGLFEYVNRKKVFKEISRVLKPNGICIIQCPNKYSLMRVIVKVIYKILKRNYLPKEPSYREMINLFKQNGFKVIELKMDDGLIWLPNFLDKLIGVKIYLLVENIFKIFSRNPFSCNMLFVVQKENKNI
jgi:ubiquinone/menaquinone biosynthesis C-methylase UbiE